MHSNNFNKKNTCLDLKSPHNLKEQLYDAIVEGNIYKTKELLLNKKVNPNYFTKFNYTPLTIAIFKGNKAKDLVKLLLENQADPNLKANGKYTPVYLAVWLNKMDVLEILITHGAKLDFYVKDHCGLNLLQKAHNLGHHNIEKYLLGCFVVNQEQKNQLLDCMLKQFKQAFSSIKPYQKDNSLEWSENSVMPTSITKDQEQVTQSSCSAFNYRPEELVRLLKNKYCII